VPTLRQLIREGAPHLRVEAAGVLLRLSGGLGG
jgi:hypothetical protein